MQKIAYPIPEAAEVIGIGRSKFYELLAAGEIESIYIGKRRLIPHDELVKLIERHRERAA
jgi:excisionase family DNA binding protein